MTNRTSGAMRIGLLACVLLASVPAAVRAAPNPAAQLCVKDGAKVVIEQAPDGGEHGVCVFPGGTRIDEWTYYRTQKQRMPQ